jgi:hypothetical protein
MKRRKRQGFYSKADVLFSLDLEAIPSNYRLIRAIMPDELVQSTDYDRKHTFSEREYFLLLSHFKKQA